MANNIVEKIIRNGQATTLSPRTIFDKVPDKVFYLSYGSNMCWDRFMCYIAGGTIEGNNRIYLGSHDKSTPTEDVGVGFNGEVFFAGHSKQWEGGVFFADFNVNALSLGRAFMVTASQFEDVAAQECGLEAGSLKVDFCRLLKYGNIKNEGMYGNIVYLGVLENIPVVSFTTPYSFNSIKSGKAELTLNPPSQAYVDIICRGIVEKFNVSKDTALRYLNSHIYYSKC